MPQHRCRTSHRANHRELTRFCLHHRRNRHRLGRSSSPRATTRMRSRSWTWTWHTCCSMRKKKGSRRMQPHNSGDGAMHKGRRWPVFPSLTLLAPGLGVCPARQNLFVPNAALQGKIELYGAATFFIPRRNWIEGLKVKMSCLSSGESRATNELPQLPLACLCS